VSTRAEASILVSCDVSDIILLGHSFGGTVIARVAEEIPELISRLVFWNAFVPQPGNSLLDEISPHYRTLFEELAAGSGDNSVILPFPIWREAFIQDVDLDTAERVCPAASARTGLSRCREVTRSCSAIRCSSPRRSSRPGDPEATATAGAATPHRRGPGRRAARAARRPVLSTAP
jgi:pimeloyl-ACP methyl ester carboxylesterase